MFDTNMGYAIDRMPEVLKNDWRKVRLAASIARLAAVKQLRQTLQATLEYLPNVDDAKKAGIASDVSLFRVVSVGGVSIFHCPIPDPVRLPADQPGEKIRLDLSRVDREIVRLTQELQGLTN